MADLLNNTRFITTAAELLQNWGAPEPTFLINPNWQANQLAQIDALPMPFPEHAGHIMIPTGGTSGGVRFAMHTYATLEASARATASALSLSTLNSYSILPEYHVSGLMPHIRAHITGGQSISHSWEALKAGNPPAQTLQNPLLSLVPTQLQTLIEIPALLPWLQSLHAIFLGGASTHPQLLKKAKELKLPIALTYGSTETASMVTLLQPSDFLNGYTHSGYALNHAKLSLSEQTGTLQISGPSIFKGYYPEKPHTLETWDTQDLARLEAAGGLTLLGRADAVIISGGENIHPLEVQNTLLAHPHIDDAYICGVEDPKWGRAVGAYFTSKTQLSESQLRPWLKKRLPAYQVPKYYLQVAEIPKSPQGKILREELPPLA